MWCGGQWDPRTTQLAAHTLLEERPSLSEPVHTEAKASGVCLAAG